MSVNPHLYFGLGHLASSGSRPLLGKQILSLRAWHLGDGKSRGAEDNTGTHEVLHRVDPSATSPGAKGPGGWMSPRVSDKAHRMCLYYM